MSNALGSSPPTKWEAWKEEKIKREGGGEKGRREAERQAGREEAVLYIYF